MKVPVLAVLFLGFPLVVGIAREQLPNLNQKDPAARFTVSDISWPANPGDAEICLWKDDKLAAASITIDDNPGPDLEWWIEQAETRKIPLTWFLITERISGPNKFNRSWEDWAGVLPKGHALESHTVLHLNVDQAGWAGVEWEYADSIKQIEEKIPGHQVAHLAYPGGKNSGLNDRDLAAKYYASARGTTGKINPPNKIDYLGVFAMTAPNLGDGGKWADLNMLFQPGNAAYRGWAVLIYHYVKDKSTVEPYLAFFDEHRDNLWLGLYGDVARYGQQRDTATLTVTEKSGDRIVFDLTDRMDDQVFDYPLTIKIHLPPAWNGVSAMQKGAEISSRLVENGNAKFALVDAVPNQGEVTLEPR